MTEIKIKYNCEDCNELTEDDIGESAFSCSVCDNNGKLLCEDCIYGWCSYRRCGETVCKECYEKDPFSYIYEGKLFCCLNCIENHKDNESESESEEEEVKEEEVN